MANWFNKIVSKVKKPKEPVSSPVKIDVPETPTGTPEAVAVAVDSAADAKLSYHDVKPLEHDEFAGDVSVNDLIAQEAHQLSTLKPGDSITYTALLQSYTKTLEKVVYYTTDAEGEVMVDYKFVHSADRLRYSDDDLYLLTLEWEGRTTNVLATLDALVDSHSDGKRTTVHGATGPHDVVTFTALKDGQELEFDLDTNKNWLVQWVRKSAVYEHGEKTV